MLAGESGRCSPSKPRWAVLMQPGYVCKDPVQIGTLWGQSCFELAEDKYKPLRFCAYFQQVHEPGNVSWASLCASLSDLMSQSQAILKQVPANFGSRCWSGLTAVTNAKFMDSSASLRLLLTQDLCGPSCMFHSATSNRREHHDEQAETIDGQPSYADGMATCEADMSWACLLRACTLAVRPKPRLGKDLSRPL